MNMSAQWSNLSNIPILRTIHGSNLYNLNHENSDEDWYEVYFSLNKNNQIIEGNSDIVQVSLSNFLKLAAKGVPQALEAMYSHAKECTDFMQHISNTFQPTIPESFHTYCRTIRGFSHGDLKRQRHAIRLTYNLNDLYKEGRKEDSTQRLTPINGVWYSH